MTEENDRPLALPAVCNLYPLKVLELAAVVHSNTFEQGIEQLPELPFKAVYGLYHAGRRVVFYQDHDPHAGSALCQHQQGLL